MPEPVCSAEEMQGGWEQACTGERVPIQPMSQSAAELGAWPNKEAEGRRVAGMGVVADRRPLISLICCLFACNRKCRASITRSLKVWLMLHQTHTGLNEPQWQWSWQFTKLEVKEEGFNLYSSAIGVRGHRREVRTHQGRLYISLNLFSTEKRMRGLEQKAKWEASSANWIKNQ